MTSIQVQQWLREGIEAAQAGDSQRAYDLLLKVVDVDEYNEQAWLWLSSVVESETDRKVCLENVLAINPENKLAIAGLVHLRSETAQAAAELEPEPESRPEGIHEIQTAEEALEALQAHWWEQPEALEQTVEPADLWVPHPSAEAEAPEGKAKWWRFEPRWKGPSARAFIEGLVAPIFLALGLLAGAVAVNNVMQLEIFDSAKRDYVSAMRTLWDEYDAWWNGPQGALIDELNSFCGPGADGWRNRDVLSACSEYPMVDCAALVGHCGSDIEAMQKRVDELAQEVQQGGNALLAAFDDVAPPEDIAPAHNRFLTCLETRVADAARVAGLARREPMTDPDYPPACQMFSYAEAEVQAFIETQ